MTSEDAANKHWTALLYPVWPDQALNQIYLHIGTFTCGFVSANVCQIAASHSGIAPFHYMQKATLEYSKP